jgi:fibronectin-binding autotransporter adhesin
LRELILLCCNASCENSRFFSSNFSIIMKSKPSCLFPPAFIVFISAVATTVSSFAASGTWTSNVSGDWTNAGNWTGGVPNASTEIATLGGNWTGQTINVDAPIMVGQILASDSASVTGGLTLSGNTITLSNGGTSPVISTGPNSNFTETAALRFKISSVLDGTNGFERQGSGYLDLSGVTNIFTGTIKLTAAASGGGSFTVINSDANLGNAANVITVATNSQPVGFYNDASAGSFTLNSARSITTSGTGDFWVKNKAGANMTIAGVISGTANFRKNDGGIVTLTGENTYALATKLEGGTLRLSGGANRLPTTTTVQFIAASTLDLTNTSQSVAAVTPFGGVTNTITGTGGSLTVTNNANFTVNAADATVLDMSGLTNFTYNQPTRTFLVQPVTSATTSNNTINLAKAGTNAITALNVTVGGATGTSQGTAHEGRLTLGTVNNFNATNVTVGGFNGSGRVSFQSGLTTPALTLRGLTGGSSAVTLWKIGETSSGTRSGAGVFDLTGGSLDAVVTDLVINRHVAGASTAIASSLTMPAGSVVATNILLGEKTGTGTPVLTSNFNQGGGVVKVSTLTFGKDAGGGATPDFRSSYNLSGGTLSAAVIDAGSGAFATTSQRRIGWTGGTISNHDASTDLSINGVSGTGGSIILAASTATSKDFHVDTGRKITLGANTSLTGSADLSKNGSGTLLINGASSTYTGTLSVNAGTLGGATSLGGSLTIGVGGTLAPGNSPGTVSVAGDVNMAGTYAFEFNDVGDLADLVNVGGTLTLTGGLVTWDNLGTYVLGEKFTLFAYDALVGTFTGYATSGNYTLDGGLWFLNYNDTMAGLNGGTNDGGANSGFITITAVPEPNSAMLVGGLGLLALLRRRR